MSGRNIEALLMLILCIITVKLLEYFLSLLCALSPDLLSPHEVEPRNIGEHVLVPLDEA